MKIGILKCGTPTKDTLKKQGDLDKIFKKLLLLENSNVIVKGFDCIKEQLPKQNDFDNIDGFIITGSKYSSYDKQQWIRKLKTKIREMDRKKIKLVGICFGHQLIAEALGGKVILNSFGWEVSVSNIKMNRIGKKLFNSDSLNIQSMHKDIVSDIKNTGLRIFSKNDCGIQGMIKDDHIFTLQGHPEYLPSTVKTLLLLRKDIIPLKICQKGLKKLTNSTDSKLISKFIGKFFMNPNYLTDILSKSSKKIGVAKKVSQKKTDKKKN
jgi:GMP synthase-like glutamine amidotransferase